MERFISDNVSEARNAILALTSRGEAIVICGVHDVDSALFSTLFSKSRTGETVIREQGEGCDVKLEGRLMERRIEVMGRAFQLGPSSFTSLIPLSNDDVLQVVTGIIYSASMEGRKLTAWEDKLLEAAEGLGAIVEVGPKIFSYKFLPLVEAIHFTVDPYIPTLTGKAEGVRGMLRSLGIGEDSTLEKLNEKELNALINAISVEASKFRRKFSREEMLSKRVFFLDFDTLELAYSLVYSYDLWGVGAIYEFATRPSFAQRIVRYFRNAISQGFDLYVTRREDGSIEVSSNIRSKELAKMLAAQIAK